MEAEAEAEQARMSSQGDRKEALQSASSNGVMVIDYSVCSSGCCLDPLRVKRP